MRITAVIGSLRLGGAENSLANLANDLARHGEDVAVMTIARGGDHYSLDSRITRYQLPTAVSRDVRWFDVPRQASRCRALRRSILGTKPDVVLSFLDTANVLVLGAMLRSNIPIVVSERVDVRMHTLPRRWNWTRAKLYSTAESVVLQTEGASIWARHNHPAWNITTIPNGIDPPPEVDAVRLKASRNLVAVGRLEHVKGFDLLLRAFASVAAEYPDWELTIAGEGPERSALLNQARSDGIASRVNLVGSVSPVWPLLASADVFVLSSRYEGFPNALSEAMAAGCAVLSFDCNSGPGELVRDGVNGVLVPTGDVDALAAALGDMMRDASLRKRLGAAARDVTIQFSRTRVADQWIELLRSVSSRGRSVNDVHSFGCSAS